MKSDKIPYITYADMEFLIKKVDECVNNQESSSTTKIGEHISCWCSMWTIWVFDNIDKNNPCHGKDCIKKFCRSLREHVKNIIDFEKKISYH